MQIFFYFNYAHFLELQRHEQPTSDVEIFFNKVMAKVFISLFGSLSPRVSEELRNHLQLSPTTKIGEWYLFENHTIIRVYGFEVEQCLLPLLLTPIMYAFEYIRHRFASHFRYFGKFEKAITFKFVFQN